MTGYIVTRIIQALFCLITITIIVFGLTRLSGDPVLLMVPPEASQEQIEVTREVLGLNKPLYVQYWKYISGIAIGDFGQSLRWNVSTLELFLNRFPNTLKLASCSMLLSIIIGIPVGILAAVNRGGWYDKFGKVFALLGQSLPVFWVGIMLIMLFSVKLGILPTSGTGGFRHLIMPTITLGWYFTAALTRLTRSSMLDVLETEDYILMARIKGVPEYKVVLKHAFKNASIPVITLGAINFVILLNGTVITETIFNYPGIGKLVVDAIFTRDFPVVQTCVLFASSIFVFMNLFVDILYCYLDPRIRYS